ncbi:MAG TPA: DUF1501 domain-containing protein, partial [Armatimonadota bacterium]|nr:DUF1501 domain-containing protein [Armatimonadota bacterium]
MDPRLNRRQVIRSLVGGSLVLPGILSELLSAEAARADSADPLAPKAPHFPAKAKRVIFMCMSGGVSHVDTFDPKPKLAELNNTLVGRGPARYLGPGWEFKRGGKCGTEVSDLFPHVRECVDDLCVIRSMKQEHNDHAQCTLGLHSGSVTFTRPSIGSWVSYGLGAANRNLPTFVVLAPQLPYAGAQAWTSDFLPACHQGTRVVPGAEPVPDLVRRAESERVQALELGLLDRFNRMHKQSRPADPLLDGRIKSFEIAYGMQREMPEVLDLSQESDATLEMYGLERGSTKGFGWQCLVARRLAERGVRYIQLYHWGWDSHGTPTDKGLNVGLVGRCRDTDQPT